MMGLQFLTGVSARNPKSTIAIATALSVLLMIVGLLTNFTIDVDENSLWTPTNAYSVKHNDWIQQESGFPKAPRYILLLFHNNGQNVLGKQPVEHIFETLETMYNVSGFDTICPLSTNNTKICDLLGVPLFWNMSKQIFESTVSNDEDAIRAMSSLTFPSGQPVIDDSLFGYPQRDPNTTLLTSVLGYSLIVQVPDTSDAIEWELDVVDAVLGLNSQWKNEFRVEISADSSFSEEFTRAIITDIPLVPLVFLIMSLFTFTIFSNFKNRVTSRSLLGFSAVVAVLLSMMTGYGILFISGIPFTSVTQVRSFSLLFGQGNGYSTRKKKLKLYSLLS
jgi:Niemann-Pick C1 protein